MKIQEAKSNCDRFGCNVEDYFTDKIIRLKLAWIEIFPFQDSMVIINQTDQILADIFSIGISIYASCIM